MPRPVQHKPAPYDYHKAPEDKTAATAPDVDPKQLDDRTISTHGMRTDMGHTMPIPSRVSGTVSAPAAEGKWSTALDASDYEKKVSDSDKSSTAGRQAQSTDAWNKY